MSQRKCEPLSTNTCEHGQSQCDGVAFCSIGNVFRVCLDLVFVSIFDFLCFCRWSATGQLQPRLAAHAVVVLARTRCDHFTLRGRCSCEGMVLTWSFSVSCRGLWHPLNHPKPVPWLLHVFHILAEMACLSSSCGRFSKMSKECLTRVAMSKNWVRVEQHHNAFSFLQSHSC